ARSGPAAAWRRSTATATPASRRPRSSARCSTRTCSPRTPGTSSGSRPGSALAGVAVGGAVDAAVGGASLMAGAVLGGLVGGGTALYGLGRRFVRARQVTAGGLAGWVDVARRYWSGGRRFTIGPHAKPNFPWVLLDRALLH